MKPENTANLVAGISLVFSGLTGGLAFWAFLSSRKTTKEQTALQAKLTTIEEARRAEQVEARQHARVTVSISRVRNLHWRLELTNESPAVARSVTLEISSATEAKPPQLLGGEGLPADIHPGQSLPFDLLASVAEATLLNALVRWTDDAGSQEATYPLRTM